jgi:hypothetical protein
MNSEFYVDLLMAEWGLEKHSRRIQTCMRRVLGELTPQTLLVLRREPRLQVVVHPEEGCSVWAYFPIHKNRFIVRHVIHLGIQVRPTVRVLLVISEARFYKQPLKLTRDQLRDHLGHVLLYLRSPKAQNDCRNAGKEWRRSCHCKSARKAA